jgi:hypothetical protein
MASKGRLLARKILKTNDPYAMPRRMQEKRDKLITAEQRLKRMKVTHVTRKVKKEGKAFGVTFASPSKRIKPPRGGLRGLKRSFKLW